MYPERIARATPAKARTPSEALRLPTDADRAARAAATSRAEIARFGGPAATAPPDGGGSTAPPAGMRAARRRSRRAGTPARRRWRRLLRALGLAARD